MAVEVVIGLLLGGAWFLFGLRTKPEDPSGGDPVEGGPDWAGPGIAPEIKHEFDRIDRERNR